MIPEPGERARISFPEVKRDALAGAPTVLFVRRPGGVVSLSVVARGGASAVPPDRSGLAALTARMMTEGTRRHPGASLAEAVESLGAAVEQGATRDAIRVGLTVLRDDLAAGLSLLSEVVETPAFAATELERVRREWLDGLEAERQSPGRVATLAGLRALLGPTLGAPVGGSRAHVRAITRADLVRLHREQFVDGEVAVVIVGDVDEAEARRLVREHFRASGRGRRPPPPAAAETTPPPTSPAPRPDPASPPRPRVLLVDRPGAVQTALFLGQAFPPRAASGHEAREAMTTAVGGLFTSRLNSNLREEHAYTYGASAQQVATRQLGAFIVLTSVHTEVTADAISAALDELSRARDPALGRPFTADELDRARADLAEGLGATLLDVGDVSARVETLHVHGLPADYFSRYPPLLDALTPADLARESARLDPDSMVVVAVGDAAAIAPALAARGLAATQAAPDLVE